MMVVCDMGPLHYLVLVGAEHVLPQLFTRILVPPAVMAEMNHPNTPEPVRLWAASPPSWLEVREPKQVEDIPSLGKKGTRGLGEKAAIALAREEQVDAIIIDDNTGRREAVRRGLRPVWMLSVLDEAAERGLIGDLAEKLDHLEHRTPFYVGEKARQAIEGMLRRDIQRKQAQELDRKAEQASPTQDQGPEQNPEMKHRRGFGRRM